MIANMTKYAFLVFHSDYIGFVEKLQNIGVVHIQQKSEGLPDDEEIAEKLKFQQELRDTLKTLKLRHVEAGEVATTLEPDEIVRQTKYLYLKQDVKRVDLQQHEKELALLKPWGKFSWTTIEKLKEAGRIIHFFSCSTSKFDPKWKEQFDLFEISVEKSGSYFVIITSTPELPSINADVVKLPGTSQKELLKHKIDIEQQIDTINKQLDQLAASSMEILQLTIDQIHHEINFKSVVLQAHSGAEDKLRILEGWVPEDNEPELVQQLENEGIYFTKSKPAAEDNVPILLKNNAFSKLFELVGSLYSLPSYREIDLTPFFAPFFMLFFGFCLGDAGYGILMMIATLILRAKAKPNMKPVWTLGFLFGISTVIMGIVGGTVFGVMIVDLKFSWLGIIQKIILDQNQLMYFSIALGLIQIVFGMCLKAARAAKIDGIKYALSTIGWIIIILGVGGAFGLSEYQVINPELAKYLMIGFGGMGGILALFFNSPGKNIFLNFGLGLWDTYGTVTGLLGDVLSYIRLFALGLSSAVLGSVFNKLAFELTGQIPVLSVIFTILILLVGHTINFFMAALGSFVHPLRLTFVEFYKNTGFEGGGKKYTPFRKAEN